MKRVNHLTKLYGFLLIILNINRNLNQSSDACKGVNVIDG